MARVVHFEIPADDVERAKAFYSTAFGWQFQDYAAHARILAAGGSVALPKTALTGMAWQGYYLDTEGNAFGIHRPDPNAA